MSSGARLLSGRPNLREGLGALRYVPALFRQVWRTSWTLTVATVLVRAVRAILPVLILYVAKLIIHRYAMLGILDENGYPISHMGVMEVPKKKSKAAGPKTLAGKVCKECHNATLIKKDGCEFCTSCGAIGACG